MVARGPEYFREIGTDWPRYSQTFRIMTLLSRVCYHQTRFSARSSTPQCRSVAKDVGNEAEAFRTQYKTVADWGLQINDAQEQLFCLPAAH
jgi:hypothetical protein